MPLIEELPLTNPTRITPGWALVPDNQPITALEPGKRSRAGAASSLRAGGFSAKQQKATEARLAKLEKENHQDVSIALPKQNRDRERRTKMTSNVRRILTYQRNFQHYLADELALAQAGGGATATVVATPVQGGRRREITTAAAAKGSSRKASSKQQSPMRPPARPKNSSTTTSSQTATPIKREVTSTSTLTPTQTTLTLSASSSDANNPLLKPLNLPKPPSATVMAALLAEPPLSYNAARATLSSDEKPPRHFCGSCGYWGKVRCRACGAGRTCGLLECYKAHREVCEGLLR